jgi:hypothetical protein
VRVGLTSLRESGQSTLRGKLRARLFYIFMCMTPLQLWGMRGNKSTPSVGWEVSVKSPWLASERKEGSPMLNNIFDSSSPLVTVLLFELEF